MILLAKIGAQPFPRSISRAIIDDHDFLADVRQRASDAREHEAQRDTLVVDRDDDREH